MSPRPMITSACAQCGKEFTSRNPNQRFCSIQCVGVGQRKHSQECVDCGGPLANPVSKRCKRCHNTAVRARRSTPKPVRQLPTMNRVSPWSRTLTPAQTETISRIRLEANGGRKATGSDGWRVYMIPTIGPAEYVELRHYLTEGRVARWAVEKDGTVSADNDRGELSKLHPVAS